MANELLKIGFNKNWNKKLYCKFFTTIRPTDTSKYIVLNWYKLICNNEYIENGQIIEAKHFLLKDIPLITCYTDAGMNKDEYILLMKTLYPNYDFDTKTVTLLLIKREYD